MHTVRRSALAAVSVSLLLFSPAARADDPPRCPAPAGADPKLAALPAAARLRFLSDGMRRAARRSLLWAGGWATVQTGSILVNAALLGARFNDRGQRIDAAFSIGTAGVGVLSMVLNPPAIIRDARAAARVARGPDPCAALRTLEQLLDRDVRNDTFGVGPLSHIGSLLFNLGVGAVLDFGFGRTQAAISTIAVGMVVGELIILTRPLDSLTLQARYRAGLLHAPPPSRFGFSVAPLVAAQGGGAVLGLSF